MSLQQPTKRRAITYEQATRPTRIYCRCPDRSAIVDLPLDHAGELAAMRAFQASCAVCGQRVRAA